MIDLNSVNQLPLSQIARAALVELGMVPQEGTTTYLLQLATKAAEDEELPGSLMQAVREQAQLSAQEQAALFVWDWTDLRDQVQELPIPPEQVLVNHLDDVEPELLARVSAQDKGEFLLELMLDSLQVESPDLQ